MILKLKFDRHLHGQVTEWLLSRYEIDLKPIIRIRSILFHNFNALLHL